MRDPPNLDLVEDDVACRHCGVRARPGYRPTTEACSDGPPSESGHTWVAYGALDDV